MIETKLLNLNYEKSKFIVIGQKKARNEMKKKLENNPLMLGENKMKETNEEKYLGIWLAPSVADSVSATVTRRLGIATRAIHEIRSVIESK